jgi:hypothetical protein
MLKLIFFILKITILAIFVLAVFLAWEFYIQKERSLDLGPLTVIHSQNGFYLSVDEKDKPVLKFFVGKINKLIYREATVHNPDGDMMPDYIDDVVKEKIKDRFK